MRALLLPLVLFSVPALAQCPADRPIERLVVDTMSTTCTLLACMGTLVCPDNNTESCYRVPVDCNRCASPIRSVCLTAEELAAAKQRK